jgi:hypothetical protein
MFQATATWVAATWASSIEFYCLIVERMRLFGEEIQRAHGVVIGEQLERHTRPDRSLAEGVAAVPRPAVVFDGYIVDLDHLLLPGSRQTRTGAVPFLDFVEQLRTFTDRRRSPHFTVAGRDGDAGVLRCGQRLQSTFRQFAQYRVDVGGLLLLQTSHQLREFQCQAAETNPRAVHVDGFRRKKLSGTAAT